MFIVDVAFWVVFGIGAAISGWFILSFLFSVGWHLCFGLGHAIFMILVVATEPENRKPWWGLRMLGLPLLPFLEGCREATKATRSTGFYSNKWIWRPLFKFERKKK